MTYNKDEVQWITGNTLPLAVKYFATHTKDLKWNLEFERIHSDGNRIKSAPIGRCNLVSLESLSKCRTYSLFGWNNSQENDIKLVAFCVIQSE